MKTRFIITLSLVFAALFCTSQTFPKPGAGVTIIVHGWNPDGSQPAWMLNMANEIIARSGGSGKVGTITVSGTAGNLTATCSNWNFNLANDTTGEIVILVNWTAVSNHLLSGVTAQSVAAVVAPKIYQSQNSQPALSELPIHLIGHSRGGGMVYEIARLLGLQGIEVEQLTSLDPHPLTVSDPQGLAVPLGPGQTIDTPIQIYENILFADNYYQNINYPGGQYVTGAYNRFWTSLPGGYHNETGYTYNILGINYNFSDHLNIILLYNGTIELSTPFSNGQATMTSAERGWYNTYENGGHNTGFVYSRNIAGNRKSTDIPNGGDAVKAGYNNATNLGGLGARAALTWTNAVWPNIISMTATMNMVPLVVGNSYSIGGSDQIILNMPYRANANGGTVNVYLDNDRNPYNGAFLQDNSPYSAAGSSITITGSSFQPTELMDANYYILVEINDGSKKRFMYAPYQFYRYCSVNINDTNFQSALLAISGLDADLDGIIECSEAAAWTAPLDVFNKNISDLTGIEAFTNITHLDCENNQLTNLDLTSNKALTHLWCNDNLLTSLNVTTDSAFIYLNCYNNLLGSLNVSGLTSLQTLICKNNHLTTLNISSNTALTDLFCDHNLLTGLNCSANTALVTLDCYNNLMTSINTSGLTNFMNFNCSNNQLSNLNVSSNTSLSLLDCHNNLLTTLNVKNGNNINFEGFNASNNPTLSCIQVDNPVWSTTNWTSIDSWASFSTTCITGINELSGNSLSIYPNPVVDELTISNISLNSTISIYDLNGRLLLSKITKSEIEKIDVSALVKGIYTIQIKDNINSAMNKLIKQ